MAETMKRVMDYQQAEHFYAWLERTIHISEQHTVEQQIHALLADHPDLMDRHSWPEMQRMAERNAEYGIA